MQLNREALELLKTLEGFSSHAYRDGGGVPTIGFGFIAGVKPGDTITREDAEIRLLKELKQFEECVTECIKVPVTSNQFSALVLLAYNIGCEAFRHSTLLKMLNEKAPSDMVALQFMRWIYDNGKVVKGLKNRREKEMALFNQGI